MRRRLALLLAATLVAGAAIDCRAIEMFTFYGDGSRIGLPSLEVPIEAYPGIPLRSDRIRMRRRGSRSAPTVAAKSGQAAAKNTITLREAASAPGTQPAVPVAPEPR